MSNSLVKLIDTSLLPAIFIVFGKFMGIFLVSKIFGIDVSIVSSTEALISFKSLVASDELLTLVSYSDLFMFAVVSVGFLILIFRSVYLHDTHVDVATVTKLAKYNLLSLIKTSYELYHEGITWLIFTWLAELLIWINVLSGKAYPWVGLLTTMFSIILTIILFRDLFNEVELTKKKLIRNAL